MIFWLTVTAAIASGLVGGVFFAFSSFVMPALGRIPPAEGIRAMQRINIDVFTLSFEVLFFGTPALCLALAAQALWRLGDPASLWLLAGGAVYLLGCLLVTGAGNVPLNNKLARVDADEVDAAREWAAYAEPWTRWNHVRTLACTGAAGAYIAAALAM